MKHFLLCCFIIALGIAGFSFKKISSGGMVAATGAPGEGTCAGCHSGGAAGTSVSVSAAPAFTNNNYVPGQSYTITVTVSHASQPAFGFDCEILNSSNADAGTIQNAGPGVQIASFAGKNNATHTSAKSGAGGAGFSFEWVAPNSGTATIYVAGNAVNLNAGTSGDTPGNTSLALTPVSTASLPEHAGVLSGVSFFPNPAADITSVSYFLKYDTEISVELLEVNGKLVKNLVNEDEAAGPHSHFLDLKNIAKGVYFLKISSGNETLSQKLFVLQ